jgi:hypothetical protein
MENTLYCSISDNIGQVRIENADAEVERMNLQFPNEVWRKDFSEFMYCWDETEDDVANPCKLNDGYCWVTCAPEK